MAAFGAGAASGVEKATAPASVPAAIKERRVRVGMIVLRRTLPPAQSMQHPRSLPYSRLAALAGMIASGDADSGFDDALVRLCGCVSSLCLLDQPRAKPGRA